MSNLRSQYQQFVRNAFDISYDLLAAVSHKLSKRPVRKLAHRQCQSELERARKKSWSAYYKVMARQLHNDED